MNNIEPQRLAYSVREAAELMSVSPNTLYREISAQRLLSRRLGNRTLIYASDLKAFADSIAPSKPRPGPNSQKQR